MKSFSSGNRLLCLLFMHIRFQVTRIFSAFQDKLEHNYIVKVFVSTVEEKSLGFQEVVSFAWNGLQLSRNKRVIAKNLPVHSVVQLNDSM